MLPVCVDADQALRCSVLWRPWSLSPTEARGHKTLAGGVRSARPSGGVFHHPVRLFLPRSRMQEYLSRLGSSVLASFPVQATLHFYNDEDSSSEEEEDEEHANTRCRLWRP
ncbi:protein ripply3 [Danio rerio]|uniref:Protein ripply3 n=1 Tax=Danio rerio TaxID=7955 RepID=DSCR6_DANRE|nr:RecName: Full=Protein ripply3; AltName: Full=Down syndrome critical region protein 6 homolog [Danio rerio]BAE53718.1 Ripply3 [Danio rerio]